MRRVVVLLLCVVSVAACDDDGGIDVDPADTVDCSATTGTCVFSGG